MATTTYFDAAYSVHAIQARTNSGGTGVTDLTAEESRLSHEFVTEGWLMEPDSCKVAYGPASTMNVTVGSPYSRRDFYVVEGTATGQGKYMARLAARTTVAIDVADSLQARKDEIYLVVEDNAYDANGRSLARLGYRTGTAGANPTGPGPDAGWNAYALLATIDVPAGIPDILSATITDERTQSQLLIDAVTLDGFAATDFSTSAHTHASDYAPLTHVDTDDEHPNATTSVSGFMSGTDNNKLAGIEAGAQVNPTASEILTDLKTVDGAGSGLDADLLDGIPGASFSLSGHNHNTRYYTETESNSQLNAKRNKPEGVFLRSNQSVDYVTGTLAIVGTAAGQMLEDRDDWGGHLDGSSTFQVGADAGGKYLVVGQIGYEANATGLRQASLNTIYSGYIAHQRRNAISGDVTIVQVRAVWDSANSADEIQLHYYQTSGGNLQVLKDLTFLRVVALEH